MKTHELLSRLEKVRQTGPDGWVACCPAHADRSPSMAITEKDDRVLIHCFAGCDVDDILGAVGMTFEDLFPPSNRAYQAVKKPFSDRQVLAVLKSEALIIKMAVSQPQPLTPEDSNRAMLAISRLSEVAQYA